MKKTNRIKVKLPQISTREEAAAMVGSIAESVNEKVRVTNLMDEKILAIQKDYGPLLETLSGLIDDKTSAVRGWAEAHRDEFPKDRKSIKFVQGTIGFRTDPPSLVLLSRRWTWAKVVEALQLRLPAFLRDKPEVDKEAILAQREDKLIAESLPLVGLKVAQPEGFYIEPNLTEVKTRQTTETVKAAA